jgi:hypothetical protein
VNEGSFSNRTLFEKYDKKQSNDFCGAPEIRHLGFRMGSPNGNGVGNYWKCPRATFGDLGLGGAGCGQMAKAGQSTNLSM